MIVINAATWGWPQWTFLGLTAFSFFTAVFKHGQPKLPYNAAYTLGDTVIFLVVLSFGGFFA